MPKLVGLPPCASGGMHADNVAAGQGPRTQAVGIEGAGPDFGTDTMTAHTLSGMQGISATSHDIWMSHGLQAPSGVSVCVRVSARAGVAVLVVDDANACECKRTTRAWQYNDGQRTRRLHRTALGSRTATPHGMASPMPCRASSRRRSSRQTSRTAYRLQSHRHHNMNAGRKSGAGDGSKTESVRPSRIERGEAKHVAISMEPPESSRWPRRRGLVAFYATPK